MHADLESMHPVHERAVNADVWAYLALAFLFSWIAWISAIKLHAREELLNFGTAGPAVAAILLSRGKRGSSHNHFPRMAIFLPITVFCWTIISWHYSWRSRPDLTLGLNPWLIVPALLPAWVISGVVSKDSGVSSFLRKLVHRPGRWSLISLLFFPALLLIPALVARFFHEVLVTPQRPGSAVASFASGAVFFLYNLLFVAVLEEPGWRGFLLDRLQERWSPLFASLFVWLPWAVWHAPLDYFRPVPFSLAAYLQIRVAFLIPIVVIMTWFYNRSHRSTQATAVFHASMNTFPFVLPYFAPALGLLFVFAIYVIFADRMWQKNAARSDDRTAAENAA
jgi:membrane protease YdiL (CAAX protease family)